MRPCPFLLPGPVILLKPIICCHKLITFWGGSRASESFVVCKGFFSFDFESRGQHSRTVKLLLLN